MNVEQVPTEKTNSSRLQNTADTRLQGRWLVLVRIVWILLVVLALLIFIVTIPVYIGLILSICNDTACANGQLSLQILKTLSNLMLSMDIYVTIRLALTFVSAFIWFFAGGLLFWRKSNDWFALLVALALVLVGTSMTLNTVAGSKSVWQLAAQYVDYISYIMLILAILLFPNGRFVPRWTWLLMIGFIVLVGQYNFFGNLPATTNAWYIALYNLIWIVLVLSVIVTQFFRYIRVSNHVQRQQSKWVIFAIFITLLVEIGFSIPLLFFTSLNQADSFYWLLYNSTSSFSLLLIPIAFLVAILRYRLWDIDILINRTLVYGTLTILLALAYFGLIFILQSLVRAFTGQISQTPLVLVGSTLVIAAIFQPLRSRIQSIIDRRFYRRKYDAAKTLEAFSATLRDEVDLSKLREQLVTVVQETMQPAHVSLWLRKAVRDEDKTSHLE